MFRVVVYADERTATAQLLEHDLEVVGPPETVVADLAALYHRRKIHSLRLGVPGLVPGPAALRHVEAFTRGIAPESRSVTFPEDPLFAALTVEFDVRYVRRPAS